LPLPTAHHPSRSIALPAGLLGLAALACTVNLGGPEPPGPPIAVSTAEAGGVLEAWRGALSADLLAGDVTLLLDEQQVTSFLAARLAADEDPVLREPQVYLREGRLDIYGIADQGPFAARVLLAVAPRLDEGGALAFDVTSADFGPLPAPAALRESLSAVLTEAFTGTLGPLATGLRIRTFAIADGQVAIVAALR
jgi:hypothetical protein